MKHFKKKVLLLASILIASSQSFTHGEEIVSKKDILNILQYIREGYIANTENIERIQLNGRIYFEQRAKEGATIPDNKVFTPQWLDFKYTIKDGKKRYEQDRIDNPNNRYYALDNNQKLLSFETSVLKIYPLDEEDERWNRLNYTYREFSLLSRMKGYENVGRAMNTIVTEINEGKYEQDDWKIMVKQDHQDVFCITLNRKDYKENYYIDANKGFNLTKKQCVFPSKKRGLSAISASYEYQQTSSGQWILSAANVSGEEYGVVLERKLVTEDIKEEFEVPEDYFELSSLNIPPDIYTIDNHFSPPLILNEGNTTDIDLLENIDNVKSLINADIKKDEIAEVQESGEVEVSNHNAHISYDKKKDSSQASHQPQPLEVRNNSNILIYLLAGGVFAVVFILIILHTRKRSG